MSASTCCRRRPLGGFGNNLWHFRPHIRPLIPLVATMFRPTTLLRRAATAAIKAPLPARPLIRPFSASAGASCSTPPPVYLHLLVLGETGGKGRVARQPSDRADSSHPPRRPRAAKAWDGVSLSAVAEADSSIKVVYTDSKGNTIKTIEGNEGDDLLSLAHEHDIDLEGEWGGGGAAEARRGGHAAADFPPSVVPRDGHAAANLPFIQLRRCRVAEASCLLRENWN